MANIPLAGLQLFVVIGREGAPIAIEAAHPAGSKVAVVLEAAHDPLPLHFGDRVADVLRSRAPNLRAEVGAGSDGGDRAVDDARMLREGGDGEKDERGSESEL